MLWAALRASLDIPAPPTDVQRRLSDWALQFTPRVALLEEAVVMEVEASTRLFGGRRALRDRVLAESQELGCTGLAWAPNSLAALCLARAGIENGLRGPLPELLDSLQFEVLTATHAHAATLGHIGCKLLGDLRRLPRGGLNHRFGKALLVALDQAYGTVPLAHEWRVPAEDFHARLELMARVELAPALLAGARLLLLQLCGWLAARHAFVAFSPLARGFLGGKLRDIGTLEAKDIRRAMPRFSAEHYPANLRLLDAFGAEAARLGCAPATLALASLLHQGEDIIPIPGTSRPEHLADLLAAPQLALDAVTLARLDALVNRHTVSGQRYSAATQAEIDTEEFGPGRPAGHGYPARA